MNELEQTFQQVLEATKQGTSCPAHDDRNGSLSVALNGQKILLKCHAGCNFTNIVSALGMKPAQFFAPKDSGPKPRKREVARYRYETADGGHAFDVVRFHPKSFRPQRPDGKWTMEGVERIPYKLPQVLEAVRQGRGIVLVEGEKDADNAAGIGLVATTFPGGAGKWRDEYLQWFKDAPFVTCVPDSDSAGRKGMAEIAARIATVAKKVVWLELPGLEEKGDLSDWLEIEGNGLEAFRKLVRDQGREWTPEVGAELADPPQQVSEADTGLAERQRDELQQPPPLTLLSVRELLEMEIPDQDFLIRPILKEQGTGLLWAYRGVGKSWAALGIAVAVASGGKFLCWEAPNPNGVLFIDGELPLRTLQKRVGQIIASTDKEPSAPLDFLTPDVQEFGLPDLSTAAGQKVIEPFITDEIKLVILDNLSTLCRSGVENEAESWLPVQQWALSLRRRGKSVLFIHHGNKGGGQRGTSRREDILDTVIKLRHPGDYSPEKGANFECHLDKARGIHGDEAKPFEAKLEIDESGKLTWTWKPLEETTFERVVKMLRDGMPCKAIAFELGISQSAVYKHRKRAQSEGKLSNSTSQPA